MGNVECHTVPNKILQPKTERLISQNAYLCLVTHSTAIEIVYHFHYFALRRMMVMSSLDGTDGPENFSLLPGRAWGRKAHDVTSLSSFCQWHSHLCPRKVYK